jgi:hypothetical protein
VQPEKGLRDLLIDRSRDWNHAIAWANPTERHGFEATRLEREAQVHRLDRIAHWPRTREIDHVAASENANDALIR